MAKSFSLKDLLTIDLPSATLPVQGKVNTGTITPTTHKGRQNFDFSNLQLSSSTTGSLDIVTGDEFFVDRFGHDEIKEDVMRYGINSSKIKVQASQAASEAVVLGKKISVIKKGTASISSIQTKDKNQIKEKIEHHDIEKLVFKKAVSHLLDDPTAKTVLVHIFEREKELIKLEDTGDKIKTHTVVLYKNPAIAGQHQILLIDPSNFDFSFHFGNSEIHALMQPHKAFGSIAVPADKASQIYNGKRDCLDIAVKLAFGFNSMSSLDINTILQYPIVKALSNNKAINDSLPAEIIAKSFIKFDFKSQHKSNVKVGLKLYECSKAVGQNILKLGVKNTKAEALAQKHEQIFSDDKGSVKTLTDLIDLTKESFDAMHEELNANQSNLLLGDVPSFN